MENKQILCIDESIYKDDEDMMYILQKLHELALDPKVRREMDIEDRLNALMSTNQVEEQ